MALGVYQNTVLNADGTPAQFTSIIVTDSVTGDPATIYADETGGTPLSSLQTNSVGYFKFAAAGGFYDIQFGAAEDAPAWERVAIGTFQAEDYERVWRTGEAAEDLDAAITAINTTVLAVESDLSDDVTAINAAIANLQDQVDALATFNISLDSAIITPDPVLNNLDLSNLALNVDGEEIEERIVNLLNTTPAVAMTATLPKTGTPGLTKFALMVTPSQTGGVSLLVADAVADGGRLNGSSAPLSITLPPTGTVRLFSVVCYENVGGSAAKYVTLGLPTSTLDAGILSPVLTASGTLTVADHSGRTVVTSGNVVVPVANGFNCTIIAGGSHTVDAGGATEALTSNQSITVLSNGTTVWFTPIITLNTLPTS